MNKKWRRKIPLFVSGKKLSMSKKRIWYKGDKIQFHLLSFSSLKKETWIEMVLYTICVCINNWIIIILYFFSPGEIECILFIPSFFQSHWEDIILMEIPWNKINMEMHYFRFVLLSWCTKMSKWTNL